MDRYQPLVSIGLPVYNGARYLAEALASLLAQDYQNLELIISDNASTDLTEKICREFAAKDSRVTYLRNEHNQGAPRNFERVFTLSTGEYFMWAAYDDQWAPTFISECVRALERNPSAVGCCTDVLLIDEEGKAYQPPYEQGEPTFDSMGKTARQRACAVLSRTANYAIYGLMRAEALRRTKPFEDIPPCDIVRLLELNLLGPFAKVPKTLFFYRIFTGSQTADVLRSFDPDQGSKPIPPRYTPTVGALLRVVWRSNTVGWRKALLSWDVLINICLRNIVMRSLMGAEGVARFARSYRRRDLRGMLTAAPYCLLRIPDKLYSLRQANGQRLIESYQQRNMLGFLRSLPLYLLLSPSNLVRREAWSSLGRIFRKSTNTLAH